MAFNESINNVGYPLLSQKCLEAIHLPSFSAYLMVVTLNNRILAKIDSCVFGTTFFYKTQN